MNGAVLTLLTLPSFVAGEPRAVCPTPTIEAVEGDTVPLLCHLDPPTSVVDYAVDWKRIDLNKVVYSYRHKRENHDDQMDQYRGRTTLNLEDLSRGNLTLWISSVQASDSGPYRCFVSKLRTSCNIWLNVDQQNGTKTDESDTTAPPLDEPDSPDGENMKTVRAGITSTVVVLCVLIGVLVLVLGKRGSIQISNNSEKENLKTQTAEEDEDPDRAAENGLRELEV